MAMNYIRVLLAQNSFGKTNVSLWRINTHFRGCIRHDNPMGPDIKCRRVVLGVISPSVGTILQEHDSTEISKWPCASEIDECGLWKGLRRRLKDFIPLDIKEMDKCWRGDTILKLSSGETYWWAGSPVRPWLTQLLDCQRFFFFYVFF